MLSKKEMRECDYATDMWQNHVPVFVGVEKNPPHSLCDNILRGICTLREETESYSANDRSGGAERPVDVRLAPTGAERRPKREHSCGCGAERPVDVRLARTAAERRRHV